MTRARLTRQAGRAAIAALVFIVLPWLLQALPDSLTHYLRYQREAVSDGQLWRLLTGHWLHLGWAHLAMNSVAAALLLAAWAEYGMNLGCLLLQSLLICVGIGLGLWLAFPHIQWYVGMSGLLHGWVVLLLPLWWRGSRGFALAVGAGLALKLLLEQLGVSVGAGILDAPVVHQAHWLGVAVAALLVARKSGSENNYDEYSP